ncbi:MAG: ABC transporter permease [Hyphomicrobiaceae bacterium]
MSDATLLPSVPTAPARPAGRLPASSWIALAWFKFAIRYRRTIIGPAWLLVAPTLFIVALGLLFSEVNGVAKARFIPHLAIGLITWTLISGYSTGSANVFRRSRAQLLEGGLGLSDIVMVEVVEVALVFAHQIVIIVAVFVLYGLPLTSYALVSLLGVALIIINGVWMTQVFGIVGARYLDLSEFMQAAMRIAFLATPIIWIPGDDGRGHVMAVFLKFNPFYHFLQLVRAPLLGDAISPLSWVVVGTITVAGLVLARVVRARYGRFVPLWV